MKEVTVETLDPKLFEALMALVIKDGNGNYAISLKDICISLNLDSAKVNEAISLNYLSCSSTDVPRFHLDNIGKSYHYISTKKEYLVSAEDIFIICSPNSITALNYDLLDIMLDKELGKDLSEQFIVTLTGTIADCFKYAKEFE